MRSERFAIGLPNIERLAFSHPCRSSSHDRPAPDEAGFCPSERTGLLSRPKPSKTVNSSSTSASGSKGTSEGAAARSPWWFVRVLSRRCLGAALKVSTWRRAAARQRRVVVERRHLEGSRPCLAQYACSTPRTPQVARWVGPHRARAGLSPIDVIHRRRLLRHPLQLSHVQLHAAPPAHTQVGERRPLGS